MGQEIIQEQCVPLVVMESKSYPIPNKTPEVKTCIQRRKDVISPKESLLYVVIMNGIILGSSIGMLLLLVVVGRILANPLFILSSVSIMLILALVVVSKQVKNETKCKRAKF
jgi:hypothetical protein